MDKSKLKNYSHIDYAPSYDIYIYIYIYIYKILRFHGSDYEECRLLGYKNPVHTSRETHYFSTTDASRLILCKI
jgi:hypothetical protein